MSEREERWFPNWDNVEVRERYYKEKEQDKNNRREHIAWKRCKNCGRVWKMKPYEQPLLNEKCSHCGKAEMVYYFKDKLFLNKGSLTYWCGRENDINLEDNKGMEVKMRDIKERKISGSGVSEVEEAEAKAEELWEEFDALASELYEALNRVENEKELDELEEGKELKRMNEIRDEVEKLDDMYGKGEGEGVLDGVYDDCEVVLDNISQLIYYKRLELRDVEYQKGTFEGWTLEELEDYYEENKDFFDNYVYKDYDGVEE